MSHHYLDGGRATQLVPNGGRASTAAPAVEWAV